ncbi:acyl-CoA dehydrogenase family protein [Salinibacillus xinjiangensis]|uniref:Acyl-CoA dehydrogenase n=1 Tax=Salinibacillus xinjiangensis TaxID=1229268 RepID=A0A6G1X1I6_9BACI|nr:acyl-CoA dehydrogenase family protein [Salinibacillus xinjiangensis]MRG84857.1 hypothetical protein [Salinibacillus xinjiangensis]
MSEMQEMIMESTEKILKEYSKKEIVNEAENGIWAKELWDNLEAYGMLKVAVPEELMGNGGDQYDAFSILYLIGKYSAPIPLAENYIVNKLLMDLGESVQDEFITISATEHKNLFQIREKDDGWIVSGKAKYVPWARFAQKILVLGETEEDTKLALLPLDNAKIKEGKNLAGEARDEVFFDNVYVEEIKTKSVDIEEQVEKILYTGGLTRSVMMVGALENLLALTKEHISERSQFGRPLYRFQAVQQHMAQLAGEFAATNVAVKNAISSYEKNPVSKEIAFAKLRVNEAIEKVNPIAHQILAAIGFTFEHTLHHSTRRLWSWREEFGKESDWEQIIAKDLMNLNQNELWSLITNVENSSQKVDVK